MNKVPLIISLIIGLVVGFSFGSYQDKQVINTDIEALERQLEKARQFFPTTPDIRFLSGTIKSIKDNVITMTAPPSTNPFEDMPTLREVVIMKNTTLMKNTPKDPDVLQKEFDEYQKELERNRDFADPSSFPTPSLPYNEVKITVDDLVVGDAILVTAAQNIKTAKRFDAERITVQEAGAGFAPPAAPALAPAPPPVVVVPEDAPVVPQSTDSIPEGSAPSLPSPPPTVVAPDVETTPPAAPLP